MRTPKSLKKSVIFCVIERIKLRRPKSNEIYDFLCDFIIKKDNLFLAKVKSFMEP